MLKDEDIVEFELTSYDVWVKISITLTTESSASSQRPTNSHYSSFEVRVAREMNIAQFKYYIYKSVVTIWNQIKMHENYDISFNFLDYITIKKKASKEEKEYFKENLTRGIRPEFE